MKNLVIIFLLLIITLSVFSQNIAITDDNGYTANTSAMLDVKSLTKGMLVPRMTSVQRTAIVLAVSNSKSGIAAVTRPSL